MSWSGWRRPVAEFVAIFAGITLSLLAEDWRQSRLDAGEQVAALQMILRDLARDSIVIEEALGYGRLHEAASYWITHHWDDPNASPDSVSAVLRQTMFMGTVTPVSAAYASLKDGSRLGVIQSDSLRAEIVSYYESAQPGFKGLADAAWEERFRFFNTVHPYVLWPSPDSPGTGWPASGPVRLVVPWAEIAKDPRVYNTMMSFGATAAVLRWQGDAALDANNDLREAIQRALGGA